MVNAVHLRRHQDPVKPRQFDADRRVIEHRKPDQEKGGVKRGLSGIGQVKINNHAKCEYRKERAPALLQEMITRLGRSIHPLIAVMYFVKLPQ